MTCSGCGTEILPNAMWYRSRQGPICETCNRVFTEGSWRRGRIIGWVLGAVLILGYVLYRLL